MKGQHLQQGRRWGVHPTADLVRHLEWPFVKRVRRSGSFFILSQAFLAFPIPRRSFREPGSEEAFRAICRAHTRTNF